MVGVINVQHRAAHSHTGGELEMITTVGEQVGCMLMLSKVSGQEAAEHLPELVLTTPARQ